MKIEQVKVRDLVTPEINIRKHPDKQIEEITRSYQMFGQIRAVVIDEDNNVWAGNGFVEALRRLGEEEVSAYRMVGLTDDQKKKLMLADNKTYALGADNLAVLDDVMKSLTDFDIPGYDEDVLTELYMDIEEFEPEYEYGKVTPEVVQQIQSVTEKRAQAPVEAAAVAAEPPKAGEAVQEHEPEKTSVKKYIICPKCGEKIWL